MVFRPEGPISRRAWFSRSCTAFPGAHAPGSAETGPSGLGGGGLGASEPGAYAPGFAEIGPSGLVRASGPRFVGSACPRLRFRPETPFSGSPVRSHCHDPFCRGHGSKECVAQPTPKWANGQTQPGREHRPMDSGQSSQICSCIHSQCFRRSPASNCEPKTMNSLRGSGGMPSTTPHIMGNDQG